MLYSNAFRAVVVGILAGLVLTETAELWHLFVIAGIFGVVDALFYPAINSIIPMLVDEPTLPPANALMQGSQQLAGLIGPVLAGLLIASVRIGAAFVVDAVSFAIAATALLFVVGGRRAARAEASADGPRPSLLATIVDGSRFAWSDPAVRSLILLTAAFNLAFNGPLLVGLPFLAETSLGGGSATFGILLGAFGAGSLLGAAGAGSIARVPNLGTVVLAIAIGMGAEHGDARLDRAGSAQLRHRRRDRRSGAVTVMFATAGAIVVAASLLGFAWGVAGRMTYAPENEPS